MSNSQLKKLKSGITNGAVITLNLLPNIVSSSNDETYFPHRLLSTNTQDARLQKSFANGLSAKKKFSKTYLSKMIQLGRLAGELIASLGDAALMAGLKGVKELSKDTIKWVTENAPLLAKNAAVYHANKKLKDLNNKVNNKFHELNKKFTTNKGSGIMLTNNEMKDIIKVIISTEDLYWKELLEKLIVKKKNFSRF